MMGYYGTLVVNVDSIFVYNKYQKHGHYYNPNYLNTIIFIVFMCGVYIYSEFCLKHVAFISIKKSKGGVYQVGT